MTGLSNPLTSNKMWNQTLLEVHGKNILRKPSINHSMNLKRANLQFSTKRKILWLKKITMTRRKKRRSLWLC